MIAGLLATKDARATLGHFKGLAQMLFAVSMQNQLAARTAEEGRDAGARGRSQGRDRRLGGAGVAGDRVTDLAGPRRAS